jgi:hypothetical protein
VDCPDALDLAGVAAGQVGGSADGFAGGAKRDDALVGCGVWYPTGVFAGATAWGAASECPLIPLGVNIRQTIDPDIGDIHNAVIGADCLSAVWKGHNGP